MTGPGLSRLEPDGNLPHLGTATPSTGRMRCLVAHPLHQGFLVKYLMNYGLKGKKCRSEMFG